MIEDGGSARVFDDSRSIDDILDVIYTASLLRLFAQAQPFDEYLLTKFSVAQRSAPLDERIIAAGNHFAFVLTADHIPKSISARRASGPKRSNDAQRRALNTPNRTPALRPHPSSTDWIFVAARRG